MANFRRCDNIADKQKKLQCLNQDLQDLQEKLKKQQAAEQRAQQDAQRQAQQREQQQQARQREQQEAQQRAQQDQLRQQQQAQQKAQQVVQQNQQQSKSGRCDSIADKQQKLQCLNQDLQGLQEQLKKQQAAEQKTQQDAQRQAQQKEQQQAQQREQQEAQRQAQLKIQQDQQRQQQQAVQQKTKPVVLQNQQQAKSGRCDSISGPQQKLQCLKQDLQTLQVQQQQQATQQKAQQEAQLKAQQDQQRQQQEAVQQKTKPVVQQNQQLAQSGRCDSINDPQQKLRCLKQDLQTLQTQQDQQEILLKNKSTSTKVGSVSGTLHADTASGPVLEGVLVTVGNKTTTTDKHGRFKVKDIQAGITGYAFSKPGYMLSSGSTKVDSGQLANLGDRWLTKAAVPPLVPATPSTPPVVPKQDSVSYPLKKPTSIVREGEFYDSGYNNGVKEKDWRQHLGSDLSAGGGDPVYAIKDGVVSCINRGPSSWNKVVILLHLDGSKTVYGHVEASVSEGITVKPGEKIGSVLFSNPSENFGAHLHFGENVHGKVTCGTVTGVGGSWGWGRAPYASSRQDAINAGWIDPAQKYGF